MYIIYQVKKYSSYQHSITIFKSLNYDSNNVYYEILVRDIIYNNVGF